MIDLQMKLRANELFQIALHVFHHNVELLEVVDILRLQDLNNLHDRVMAQLPHKGDFS